MAAPIPVFASIASCFGFVMRSMNKVMVVTASTIVSVIVAIAANYVLIFGHFGCPALGIVGAAIGTVLTRFFEGGVIIIYLIASKNPVMKNIGELIHSDRKCLYGM